MLSGKVKKMSTEKKSVCSGCENEHIGCRFECEARKKERFALIKASGKYFDPKGKIGNYKTNYKYFKKGG